MLTVKFEDVSVKLVGPQIFLGFLKDTHILTSWFGWFGCHKLICYSDMHAICLYSFIMSYMYTYVYIISWICDDMWI